MSPAPPAAVASAGRRARAPAKTRIVCMSHREDADGISSAALVRAAFGAESVLVDYPEQMDALRGIAADASLKALYICDLGLNKRHEAEFAEIVEALRRRRVAVTYIDHHDINPRIAARISACGARLIHDVNECTTVQAYGAFRRRLPDHAAFVAACAAVTDYMDDRPAGSRLLQMYDRQFVLINATVLTYCITGHQKDDGYLEDLVAHLAASKYPFELDGSFEFARTQMAKLAEMVTRVRHDMRRMSSLGYMEATDLSPGGAVNFVLGLSGRDVGLAYRERKDSDDCAVSIRGSSACRTHLGRLVNRLALEAGGSGGGHDKACGASVPKRSIRSFIRALNRAL